MGNLFFNACGFTLVKLTDRLTVSFFVDKLGLLFIAVALILWLTSGIYSVEYMKGSRHRTRYNVFYWLSGLVMILMGFASNIFTFYFCYELLTLLSAPLVLQDQNRDCIKAGVKYLIYSFTGAYLVLFGTFILNPVLDSIAFSTAPMFTENLVHGTEPRLYIAILCMLIGFGVKAGMWPMHAWLPTAHPVAPSPASAVLSGMIVKAGMLGIIRVIYYTVGAGFIRGTWVQYTWMALTLITVFMGSMQAFREPLLKKRLAYSTVSNVSYILFGLSVINETAYKGSLYQFVAHACAKCALFLIAGILIHVTGCKKVADYAGIGKKYPVLMWCFMFCALSLIGIPPTGGFTAKWFLCLGALEGEGLGFLRWFGPVILLVSALLTAGYLLPLGMKAFLPGKDYEDRFPDVEKLSAAEVIPVVILTVLSVLVGIIPMIF